MSLLLEMLSDFNCAVKVYQLILLFLISEVQNESPERDVSAVLQQLALRQKQRQYNATVCGNVLTSVQNKDAGHSTDSNSEGEGGEARRSSVDRRRSSSSSRRYVTDESSNGYFDSQRSMIEQSRALLEQSKAKHHALVAQAYTMQKRLSRGRSAVTASSTVPSNAAYDSASVHPKLAPKPPSTPNVDRKMQSYRTQRLSRLGLLFIILFNYNYYNSDHI